MQSICQVNFLKTLLALSLLGFLLHPGRFAVLQYQLLHPLPIWPRCFALGGALVTERPTIVEDLRSIYFQAFLGVF